MNPAPRAHDAWDLVTSGISGSHQAIAIAWGGGAADRVMTLVNGGASYVPYLFDGTAWVPKPITGTGCVFGDARALVAGGTGDDFYAGGVTFAYTLNGGTTWVCPPLGMQYVDIRAIFPSASANRLWIGGDQNQLGAYGLLTRYTWSPGVAPSAPTVMTASGITSWQAYSIAKAPASNRLLVGAQDIGVACSDDGGINWTVASPDESQSVMWAKTGGGNRVYTFGHADYQLQSDQRWQRGELRCDFMVQRVSARCAQANQDIQRATHDGDRPGG